MNFANIEKVLKGKDLGVVIEEAEQLKFHKRTSYNQ